MKKLIYILLPLIIIYSCKKDNIEQNNENIKNIQPLKVGYSWTFVDSTFFEEGVPELVDTSTLSIVGSEITNYDGKEIELFYWKWDHNDMIWLFSNEEGDIYYYGLRKDDISYLIDKCIRIPYPVSVNETWNSLNFTLNETPDTTYGLVYDTTENTCIDKNYILKTNVGELECVVTRYNRKTDSLKKSYIYHCPDIGYVGLESKIYGKVNFKKTLISYDFSQTKDISAGDKTNYTKKDKTEVFNSFGEKLSHK